jgi:hypothetical protein
MINRELIAAGFAPNSDGTLHSPARVVLAREGEFFLVRIELSNGDTLVCHVHERALKICKREKT